jgi:hypothetical protein
MAVKPTGATNEPEPSVGRDRPAHASVAACLHGPCKACGRRPTTEAMGMGMRRKLRCAHCGALVARSGKAQIYCGRRCRQRAHYAEKVRRGDFGTHVTQDTALPTTPAKKSSKIRGLRGAKTGSGLGYEPFSRALWNHVVEVEVFGGRWWTDSVSSDGCRSQIARLRPRALVRSAQEAEPTSQPLKQAA